MTCTLCGHSVLCSHLRSHVSACFSWCCPCCVVCFLCWLCLLCLLCRFLVNAVSRVCCVIAVFLVSTVCFVMIAFSWLLCSSCFSCLLCFSHLPCFWVGCFANCGVANCHVEDLGWRIYYIPSCPIKLIFWKVLRDCRPILLRSNSK